MVMSTIVASISLKVLELETSNLVCSFVWAGECRAGAQTISLKVGVA